MVWQNKEAYNKQKKEAKGESDDKDIYDSDTDFGDVDDIGGTDIKINPDYYIHTALTRAQKCLLKDDLNAGFLSYTFFINHIENLCMAAKKLDDQYHVDVAAFEKQIKESSEKPSHPLANQVKIADYKLRLMMMAVFDNKQMTDALKTA